MTDLTKLSTLIERHRSRGVDFGTNEDAPNPEWIGMAEERLGHQLPPSFKWFLNNYGGGEICGEEIYSIYGPDFESAFGGDVVFQFLAHQHSQTLGVDEIPVATNDMGEIFFMKAAPVAKGEYQVWVKRGADTDFYADTFADFLEKRITGLSS